MGEIATKIGEIKGFVDQAIAFVRDISSKIANLPALYEQYKDQVLLYGGIALGVIVFLWILKRVIRYRRRHPKIRPVSTGANGYSDVRMESRKPDSRAMRQALKNADKRQEKYYQELLQIKRGEDYYKPRERRVFYVKTFKPKDPVVPKEQPVQVQKVYGKADQATIMATGLFGLGLGLIARNVLGNDKKKIK